MVGGTGIEPVRDRLVETVCSPAHSPPVVSPDRFARSSPGCGPGILRLGRWTRISVCSAHGAKLLSRPFWLARSKDVALRENADSDHYCVVRRDATLTGAAVETRFNHLHPRGELVNPEISYPERQHFLLATSQGGEI